MVTDDYDPLFGPAPIEVPLASAPLARVLSQIQFTPIMSLRSEEYIAPFQEAVRDVYPIVSEERLEIQPTPNAPVRVEVIWRFSDPKREWKVAISTGFVALETSKYTSRADFFSRLHTLLQALVKTVRTVRVTRIGVRYVDHVKSPEIDGMSDMLRSEMLGVTNSPLRAQMQHAMNETVCKCAEGYLLARWGLLPPGGTHDPAIMTPAQTTSWFLDLDVFTQYGEPFVELDAQSIRDAAFGLATRAYAFFRWATTDRFLTVYGGKA